MASLSQKYRPQHFKDVTGQRHVTETLRKEVATGILGHAFLFSGPRGVGKTTTARIFAKALNCENPKDGEPCNTCSRCTEANEGRMMDLIEIDAATHTQVDKIREGIVEHVRFAPVGGKRKIYVIDEAHMLSSASWNALLKTLEEPPAYAFFILATTEWHKVPETIISRCQRFDFLRIEDAELEKRIEEIGKREGWEIAPEVLKLIVSRADGCARDAETLLGQIGALGEKRITEKTAHLVIPRSHVPEAASLVALWAAADHAGAYQKVRELFDAGFAPEALVDDVLHIFRLLLAATADGTLVKKWKDGPEEESCLVPLVGAFEPAEIHDIALMLFERRKDMKSGIDPLFAMELATTLVTHGLLRHARRPEEKAKKDKEKDEPPQDSGAAPPSDAKEDGLAEEEPESTLEKTIEETVPGLAGKTEEQTPPCVDLLTIQKHWRRIIERVSEHNPSLRFILQIAKPSSVHGKTLFLHFQYPFHRDKIMKSAHIKMLVETMIEEVAQAKVLIEGVLEAKTETPTEEKRDMVDNILEAFGGSVIEQEV